jgi:hypothetical protein
MRTVADMPRVKATPKPCPIIEAHTGQPCSRDTEGLKNQCSQHGSRLSYRPDLDPGARPLGQAHPKGCPCDVHTKAPLPKCEPSCTCQRHTSTRLTCHIICQGIRCDRKIGRGHGDGQNYKGNQARQLCGGHDSRWRLNDGDTQDGLPLQPQHMGPDSERPRCTVDDCDLPRRGNGLYCSPHRQRVEDHGHTDLLRQHNIGLTCSVEWCDKVCESAADRFVMGMCPTCYVRVTGKASESQSRRRAKKAKVECDGHTIPELHKYWRARGIDPKRCTYCDAWYRRWRNNWRTSVGDHVIAIDNGGSNMMENIVPCCITCNESKGARFLYVEWTPLNMRHELTAA